MVRGATLSQGIVQASGWIRVISRTGRELSELPQYTADDIAALVALLARKSAYPIAEVELLDRLNDIGLCGAPSAPELDKAFHDFARKMVRPSGTAKAYAAIGNAKTWNGLLSAISACVGQSSASREPQGRGSGLSSMRNMDRVILTELRVGCRGRRPSNRQKLASPEQIAAIKELGLPIDFHLIQKVAKRYQVYHASMHRRGPQRDTDLDQTLESLAVLFSDLTGRPSIQRLSSEPASVFIQFAVRALRPFEFPKCASTSATGLSKRWARRKRVLKEQGTQSAQ